MDKVLLSSILVVPLLIARLAAGGKAPRRSFRRMLILGVGFNVFYALCLIYLYFKLA